MLRNLSDLLRNKKGQGLVEYALLIAGVALISAAAVSVFGHKTSDLIATVTSILPGAHPDDNGPIVSGHLIETANPTGGAGIQLDVATINTNSGTDRLGANVLGGTAGTVPGVGGLVVESN
ncbi:MAG: signal peptide protein [Planctomycetaceae bacterium]|nr:signal peptide protein [Planctomycetaceae bacterium]